MKAAPRILVVDDSYTFREEVAERLGALGFEVSLADSAIRALESLQSSRSAKPDVVLLDLVMPGMDGDVACRKIKAIHELSDLPVIMITAQEDHQTLQRCFEAGADDFIAKSSEFEVIKARIMAQIRRRHLEEENRKIAGELTKKAAVEEQARRMEELYEQAQAAVKARDEFLSIASHELKTPLSSLKLHVQMLKRTAQRHQVEIPTAELLPKLDNAERQIQRLTRLIEDLLEVSRIRNQRFTHHFERMDLVEVIRETVSHFEAEAARQGCVIKLKLPAACAGFWDRLRLEQVITNLVANALKYGSHHPIEVSLAELGESVELQVRDFGIGISEKDQERVFNRFERAVSAEHFGGLGLGLYISSQIVEAHGGRILVQSRPGQGSVFRVVLPRDARARKAS